MLQWLHGKQQQHQSKTQSNKSPNQSTYQSTNQATNEKAKLPAVDGPPGDAGADPQCSHAAPRSIHLKGFIFPDKCFGLSIFLNS